MEAYVHDKKSCKREIDLLKDLISLIQRFNKFESISTW